MSFDFDPLFDQREIDINNLKMKGKKDDDIGFEFETYETEKSKKDKKDKDTEIPKECNDECNQLKIIKFPTNKSQIKQRPYMEADIIPRHASSVIFNGTTKSGKTNLLVNLMSRPNFYGPDGSRKEKDKDLGYFDLIFMFSPTAYGDDLARFLKVPDKRIFAEFEEEDLDHIIQTQDDIIKEKGLVKSPKILIIFEDIQADQSFMNTKSFLKCFLMARHKNISTFLLSQSWTKTPRACRMQANNIFFFQGTQSESELLADEYCPPGIAPGKSATFQKNLFLQLINDATKEKHSFLHINKNVSIEDRYRKNLDTLLRIVHK